MNKSNSKSLTSMSMLDRISLHTPKLAKSNESIPLTPHSSPEESEAAEMTPMELTMEDEETVPWFQAKCKRHFKVACCLCFIALVVITVLVLTIYYHIHRKPTDDDQLPLEGSSSQWLDSTTEALPSIATSSTIPLMIFKTHRMDTMLQFSNHVRPISTPDVSNGFITNPVPTPQFRDGPVENVTVSLSASANNATKHQFSAPDRLLTTKSDNKPH